jgi:hypothetical protein
MYRLWHNTLGERKRFKIPQLLCIDAIDNAIGIERFIGFRTLNGNHEDFKGI